MNRASEGGGGALIGNLTYRADYENALGEEKVLRRTAAEKKCELPPPAAPASPTPDCVHGAGLRQRAGRAGFSKRPGHPLTSALAARLLVSVT